MVLHQSYSQKYLSHFTQKRVLFLRKHPGKGGEKNLLKKITV